jgi:diguanylate cyclase (GGDEF)-like protein
MSLRTKLTLSLIAMSLVTIAMVGGTARAVMLERFHAFVVERAGQRFMSDVIEYHRVYGSFEEAVANESFADFVARTRPAAVRRPGAPPQPVPQPVPSPSPVPRAGAAVPAPPPFVVANREGVVLFPLSGMNTGDRAPAALLGSAPPILDGGVELGLAVPLERPVMTDMELHYLAGMNDSWFYSLLLACALALPLGLVVGDRLARPIRDITRAMGEMKEGHLRQEVVVQSTDEVGRLAMSFNQMSWKLASAYEELEQSKAELDARAKEMTALSREDSLTGLLNRRAFDERASAALSQAKRYGHDTCVAMLDLDHFKQINDVYSHGVGDQVLVRTARLLTSGVRESDIVARYGGEEFVIAFPETKLPDAMALAERLRVSFEETNWTDLVADTPVTMSIGVASVGKDDGLREALGRADEGLYRAKRGGRNRIEA